MVLEYCGSGELLHSSIFEKDQIHEAEIAEIIVDLMKAFKFLES